MSIPKVKSTKLKSRAAVTTLVGLLTISTGLAGAAALSGALGIDKPAVVVLSSLDDPVTSTTAAADTPTADALVDPSITDLPPFPSSTDDGSTTTTTEAPPATEPAPAEDPAPAPEPAPPPAADPTPRPAPAPPVPNEPKDDRCDAAGADESAKLARWCEHRDEIRARMEAIRARIATWKAANAEFRAEMKTMLDELHALIESWRAENGENRAQVDAWRNAWKVRAEDWKKKCDREGRDGRGDNDGQDQPAPADPGDSQGKETGDRDQDRQRWADKGDHNRDGHRDEGRGSDDGRSRGDGERTWRS